MISNLKPGEVAPGHISDLMPAWNSGDGAFTHINQQIPSVVYASSQNGNIRRLEMGTVLPTSNIGIKNIKNKFAV